MENAKTKNNQNNLNYKFIIELDNKIKNNSASKNFFVTTNEESLNLNDNTGENYIKSIMSSDSLIGEIANLKNGEGNNSNNNNDNQNTTNIFNDDSINRALRENNQLNNAKPMIPQLNENYSKNNYNFNMNQNPKIPVLNVEATKYQIINLENKINNQSKNINNGKIKNQNLSKKNFPQFELETKNILNSKKQGQITSNNQIATSSNTKNLYKNPIGANQSKNIKNPFPANKFEENKLDNHNQLNTNYALIQNNQVNLELIALANTKKQNYNNSYIIIETNNEKKDDTPLIIRNNIQKEMNLYRYISENKWKIDDFGIGKKLGSGRFGKVYLVKEKKQQFICAIKIIFKSQIVDNNIQAQLRRELEIHSHMEHENILKFYGFFWDERRIFLILEYAPGGEIYKELKNSPNERFSEAKAGNYIYQMTKALNYLHTKHVIHRDIKPENMLNSYGTIKLSDFGWSCHSKSAERKTFCGTLDYLCPEMVNNAPHDNTLDIWCLGVLCYEFCTGAPPFESNNRKETFRKIKDVCITFPDYLSMEVKNLILGLLNKIPQYRMSLDQVLQHSWILKYKDYKTE